MIQCRDINMFNAEPALLLLLCDDDATARRHDGTTARRHDGTRRWSHCDGAGVARNFSLLQVYYQYTVVSVSVLVIDSIPPYRVEYANWRT